MSIVEPMSKVDGVLATDPIVREIAGPHDIISYLRQLNRRKTGQSTGNNDTVIWNISSRLLQLQIEQQLRVSITYFEDKELRSGAYEIRSQGVFPRVFPNQSLTPQSSSEFISLSTRPPARHNEDTTITPGPKTRSQLAGRELDVVKSSTSTVDPSTQAPSSQLPQELASTVANLVTYVEQLQQELLATKSTLQDHEALFKTMDERIRRLELENRQLHEISERQDTTSI